MTRPTTVLGWLALAALVAVGVVIGGPIGGITVVVGVAVADRLPRMYHERRLIEIEEGAAAAAPPGLPAHGVSAAAFDIDAFAVFSAPILQGRAFHSGDLEPDRLSVSYGGVRVAAGGVTVPHDAAAVAAHMAGRELDVVADLGLGSGRATVLTNDLTHAYIDENMGTS